MGNQLPNQLNDPMSNMGPQSMPGMTMNNQVSSLAYLLIALFFSLIYI